MVQGTCVRTSLHASIPLLLASVSRGCLTFFRVWLELVRKGKASRFVYGVWDGAFGAVLRRGAGAIMQKDARDWNGGGGRHDGQRE